ncbi:MAG: SOS response-associated peptidase [Polyangiales bacterium]
MTSHAARGTLGRVCGRFFLVADADTLVDEFQLVRDNPLSRLTPSWNVAPTHLLPVVGRREGGRALRRLRWGLVPHWARTAEDGAKHANARAETIFERSAFRDPARARRCLVPASGFYEWQRAGRARTPWAFAPAEGPLLAFAGLWDRWVAPDGEELRTVTLVTTDASDDVRAVHDRMPVILARDAWALWLDARSDLDAVRAVLRPAPAGTLRAWAVDPRVGSVAHNDAGLLAPAAPPVQPTLGIG